MNGTTVDGKSLWYGIVAPPSAWAIQEWLGWFFGERTCTSMTPPSVRWVLLGITVLAFLVAAVGIMRGWHTWRAQSDVESPMRTAARDRMEFMALGGFLVSTVFALAIGWAGLSTAFLSDCGRIR